MVCSLLAYSTNVGKLGNQFYKELVRTTVMSPSLMFAMRVKRIAMPDERDIPLCHFIIA